MDKRKLLSPPQYCQRCGARHLTMTGEPKCRERLCAATKDDFTGFASNVEWSKLIKSIDRNFLTSLRIEST